MLSMKYFIGLSTLATVFSICNCGYLMVDSDRSEVSAKERQERQNITVQSLKNILLDFVRDLDTTER